MDEKTSTTARGVLSAVMLNQRSPIVQNGEMESDEGINRALMRARYKLCDDLEKILIMEAIISGEISMDDVNDMTLVKIGGRGWRRFRAGPMISSPISRGIAALRRSKVD